jgi:hypothetical protein
VLAQLLQGKIDRPHRRILVFSQDARQVAAAGDRVVHRLAMRLLDEEPDARPQAKQENGAAGQDFQTQTA